jgi:hypothetical protein
MPVLAILPTFLLRNCPMRDSVPKQGLALYSLPEAVTPYKAIFIWKDSRDASRTVEGLRDWAGLGCGETPVRRSNMEGFWKVLHSIWECP